MKRGLLLLIALGLLILLVLLPLPVPPYLDFQVIYHADMGLLRGIPLYDHAGQVEMIAQIANVPAGQVHVLPFPYPPWYALAALPLALFPIDIAARLWLELNLMMLVVSIGLMTEGWRMRKRWFALAAAIPFPPVLGALFVGQYVFPALLGAALWAYAVRRENPLLIAFASALLTFKPHLGILVLLAGIVHLWFRQDAFGRRALIYTLISGIILFVFGFLADRAWPWNYLQSLLAFQQDTGVASCGLCASLPVAVVGLVRGGPSLLLATSVSLVIFLLLLLWWGLTRRAMLRRPAWLLAFSILVVLLASPYLLNYDFVLVLLPFLLLAEGNRALADRVVLAVAYLIPFVAIGLWGRQGNIVFPLSAILLLVMLYRGARQLDGLPGAA